MIEINVTAERLYDSVCKERFSATTVPHFVDEEFKRGTWPERVQRPAEQVAK